MKKIPTSVKQTPEYRALLKKKNTEIKAKNASIGSSSSLISEWVEVDRVNKIVIKDLLAAVKEASSVLRVIARVNSEMKGMDVVQNCITLCEANAFQAESVLRVQAPPEVAR